MDDAMRDAAEGRPDDGLLERVRALAEGRLDPEQAEALLLRAGADAEDRALLDAFREVHAVTRVIDDEPPECRVRFVDVERRIAAGGGRVLRRRAAWVAAAAVLVAAAGAFWALSRPGVPETVRLTAVPLVAPVADTDPLAAAAIAAAAPLADYRPALAGEPQWLVSFDTGRAVARATARPLLLFIHHPTCPLCLDLRERAFHDAGVQARLADFVPVMVDVLELPEPLQPLLGRGWPYLGVLDASGDEVAAFPGACGPAALRGHLDAALAKAGPGEPVPWGPARTRAARLSTALAAAAAGRFVEEHDELVELVRDDVDGAFGRAARALLAARAAQAGEALRHAAALPAEAERVLADAARRFSGTPWGTDLAAVRDALLRTGRFPRLEPLPEGEPR